MNSGRFLVFQLCVLTSTWAEERAEQRNPTSLLPDVPLDNQVMYPDESVLYQLVGLKESQSYEVRISYPPPIPVSFEFEWLEPEGAEALLHSDISAPVRKLLNTEKVMFHSENEDRAYVKVSARIDGISRHGVEWSRQQEIHYNIVLESLFYGVPYPVLRIAGVGLPVIALIIAFTPSFIRRFLLSGVQTTGTKQN